MYFSLPYTVLSFYSDLPVSVHCASQVTNFLLCCHSRPRRVNHHSVKSLIRQRYENKNESLDIAGHSAERSDPLINYITYKKKWTEL